MDLISFLNYVTWVPLVLWVALFFWFRMVAYPLYLKTQMRRGRKWAFLPEFASKNRSYIGFLRFRCILWTFVVIMLSTLSVVWVMWKFTAYPPVFGAVSAVLFLFVALFLYRKAVRRVGRLLQSAYFLEYRRACYESDSRGNLRNEADILNRTAWGFNRKLRNAEKHHRLRKYVYAMAASKKIPPDLYAETMNEF
ncbi:MAG: hypothetical protein IKN70_01040 [Fibrobacter sp.]|nr:hypothetical protein [Fibrobacter sp.]